MRIFRLAAILMVSGFLGSWVGDAEAAVVRVRLTGCLDCVDHSFLWVTSATCEDPSDGSGFTECTQLGGTDWTDCFTNAITCSAGGGTGGGGTGGGGYDQCYLTGAAQYCPVHCFTCIRLY
jgi:hypothetical protein